MRLAVLILAGVQLLIRGMAVPHCHAHDGRPEPAHHSDRPHAHFPLHAHAAEDKLAKHAHPHSHGHQHLAHGHQHRGDETPVTTVPADSPPPDHDQDAVYIGNETLAAPLDRIQVPDPTISEWLFADIGAESPANLIHLIECRAAGPPAAGLGTSIDHFPHVLRV
ncbi:MAG: hypothetical protein JWM11_5597 [Planctomycetaceae bacterium]|nr:hypothetical protein [Planctomycetaceae bacterium]